MFLVQSLTQMKVDDYYALLFSAEAQWVHPSASPSSSCPSDF
jgi:hypothetical protein